MSRWHVNRAEQFADPVDPAHPLRGIELWRPTWCNCLIWAGWQQRHYGGYTMYRRAALAWRWTRNGPSRRAFFNHAMWSPDGAACFEYTTTKPSWVWWWQLPFFLLYRGRVERVTRQWL